MTPIIIVVVLALGAYILMKKKTPSTGEVPVTIPPPYPAPSYSSTVSTSQGFTPVLDPLVGQTGPVKTGAILPQDPYGLQLTSAFGSDKTPLAITSPSLYYADPTRFDALSAGNCQCDDYQCCYWAPFQSKYGPMQTNYQVTRKCVRIEYGDTPGACNRAFAQYQNGVAAYNGFMARAQAAHENSVYIGKNPYRAFAVRRLEQARMSRRLTMA